MAKKKGWIMWLLTVWISLAMNLVALAIGGALVSGGITIPLAPERLALAVGWTVLVGGAVSLVFWLISFSQGLLKRLRGR